MQTVPPSIGGPNADIRNFCSGVLSGSNDEAKWFPLASCQRDDNWQLHKWQRNVTDVMLTGEILGGGWFSSKDCWLLSDERSDALGNEAGLSQTDDVRPSSGRFAFLTTVFEAYSMGDDQLESGPYQTGSAQVRVEAPGFKPLVVQFFDEMPDVRITLDKEK